jgi:hypothetical protein
VTDDDVRAVLRAELLAERSAALLRRRARGTRPRLLPLPRTEMDPRPPSWAPGAPVGEPAAGRSTTA